MRACRAIPSVDLLIVVDDGSTDDTGRAARAAGAVVVLHGQAVAFSTAGMSSNPAQSASAAAAQVAATVSTPVETESVSTGAPGSGGTAASESIPKNTGTIKVRLSFDD